MPIHARLAAAFLLIFPLISSAEDGVLTKPNRLREGGGTPGEARLGPGELTFGKRREPLKPLKPGDVVNLAERPNLINKHDESLLVSAGFLIKDGLIRKGGGAPLRYEQLEKLLRELREARKEKVLAEIAKIQREADSGGSDKLTADQASRLSVLMKSDWALIPPNIRDGLNDWLSESGAKTVRAPDLRRVLRSVEHWKKGRFALPPPLMADDIPLPKYDLPKAWPPWNTWSPVHPMPEEKELRRRAAAMNRATYIDPDTGEEKRYSKRVRHALIETVRYASDEDGAAFVETIQTMKPPIYVSNEKMAEIPFASGFARWPEPGEDLKKNGPMVVLPDYAVLIPNPKKTGKKDAWMGLNAYHPSNYAKLGLPVPDVQALDPSIKPEKVEEHEGGRMEIMPDGSARSYWKPFGVSGLLLHEVLHLDTFRSGAGAHMYTNEMRSFYAMNRMWFNRDESKGWARYPDYGKKWDWFRNPRVFRQNILKTYMSPEVAEVRPGEETVAGQLTEVERKLKLGPQAFEREKRSEIERLFEAKRKSRFAFVDYQRKIGYISKPDAEAARKAIEAEIAAEEAQTGMSKFRYREFLIEQRERLRRDQELEVEIALTDYRWHATRGLSYTPTPTSQGRSFPGSLPAAETKK